MEDNVEAVMEKVKKAKGEAILISPLDEVAWLTNLRGADIDYNPLFFSYAIIHNTGDEHRIRLYINPEKTVNVKDYLAEHKIDVFPYEQIFEDISSEGELGGLKFVVDENAMNTRTYNAMNADNLINKPDLIGEIKIKKNETQFEGMRQC